MGTKCDDQMEQKGTSEDYTFTIRHFDKKENAAPNLRSKPFLGRMDLSGGFQPMQKFDEILSMLRKAPYAFVPLMLMPSAAHAADIAPAGFESFPKIEIGFLEQLVELNKGGVVFIQEMLQNTIGLGDNSAGFAIILWAITLKILTTPFYEAAVK